MGGFCIDDIWGYKSDYRLVPNKDKTDLVCAFEMEGWDYKTGNVN